MVANPKMLIREAGDTRFRAEDCEDPGFFIDGTLLEGSLTFEVVAVKGGKTSSIQGQEFFSAMMAHFGNRVTVISAVWSDARSERRTNLDKFNEETKDNATKEDAAFATRTGAWAKAAGFSVIRSIDTTPDQCPGGYEQVLVEFVKPPGTTRARIKKRSNNGQKTGR